MALEREGKTLGGKADRQWTFADRRVPDEQIAVL
jgi:hypothetical protein